MRKSTRPQFLTKQQREEQRANRQHRPSILPETIERSDTHALVQKISRPVADRAQSEGRHASKKIRFDWNPQDDTSAVLDSLASHNYVPKSSPDTDILQARHWSKKTLSEMNERDWRIFREDYGISIKGIS